MPRVLALDYGLARTGLAVTDELQIIASPLDTVATPKLWDFLTQYLAKEVVEKIVIGQAIRADMSLSALEKPIEALIKQLQTQYPNIAIDRQDERLTSIIARQTIQQSVHKKSQRQDKNLVDKISATIILQHYLKFNI
jgi:putative Holliday junction resolvase